MNSRRKIAKRAAVSQTMTFTKSGKREKITECKHCTKLEKSFGFLGWVLWLLNIYLTTKGTKVFFEMEKIAC